MHEVKAVVRPEMLEQVLSELRSIPELSGIAVSRIRAFGRRVLHFGAPGLESAEVEMARIELVATDQLLERVLEAITLAGRTGRHRGNLNCFVTAFRADGSPIWTDHSFSCPMCVHIAREAMLMSLQGLSVDRIREEIDAHYGSQGISTDTPRAHHAGTHQLANAGTNVPSL